jgi:hypothetical protein
MADQPAERLVRRLERFTESWVSNPAGRLELVRLIRDVHGLSSRHHQDEPLLSWIEDEERIAKSIGVR